jgi:hypothetical protein
MNTIIADIIDRHTGASEMCMKIFNTFGISLSRDSMERFQTAIATDHIKDPTSEDLDPKSFRVASLDNNDWTKGYARVRASNESRAKNCTAFMAMNPIPSCHLSQQELISPISQDSNVKVGNGKSVNDNPKPHARPVKRKVDGELVESSNSSVTFNKDASSNDTYDHLTFADFDIKPGEQVTATVFYDIFFAYNVAKHANSDVKEFTLPILKVFMSRLDPPSTEASNICYLGLLDEHCDSKDTVMTVLCKFYEQMEIGTKYKYLVVVGDGKTYHFFIFKF